MRAQEGRKRLVVLACGLRERAGVSRLNGAHLVPVKGLVGIARGVEVVPVVLAAIVALVRVRHARDRQRVCVDSESCAPGEPCGTVLTMADAAPAAAAPAPTDAAATPARMQSIARIAGSDPPRSGEEAIDSQARDAHEGARRGLCHRPAR